MKILLEGVKKKRSEADGENEKRQRGRLTPRQGIGGSSARGRQITRQYNQKKHMMGNLNKIKNLLKVKNREHVFWMCVRRKRSGKLGITANCQKLHWNQKLSPVCLLCSDHTATTVL